VDKNNVYYLYYNKNIIPNNENANNNNKQKNAKMKKNIS